MSPAGSGSGGGRRRRAAVAASVATVVVGLGVVFGTPATSETPGVTRGIPRPHPALPPGTTPGPSDQPAISADGTVLAFSSTSPNLVVPATPGQTRDVYAYDSRRPAADPLERISLTSEGRPGPGPGGGSSHPSVSADGRFVAFESDAALDPADTDQTADVYVRDRATATTELISGAIPEGPSGVTVTEPSISADGRYVALTVAEVALSREPPSQIFLFDRVEQVFKLASHAPGLVEVAGDGNSYGPAVSADGGVVAFASDANNLDTRGTSAFTRVLAWTRADDTVRAVSVAAGVGNVGGLPDGSCGPPSLSADGARVVYACLATNLLGGIQPVGAQGGPNVFVTDRVSAGSILVTVGVVPECSDCPPPTTDTTFLLAAEEPPDLVDVGPLDRPSFSGDGRYVAFASTAYNLLTEGDTNEVRDVFVRDLLEATTGRVSVTSTGAQIVDGASTAPSISAEGRWVGFVTGSVSVADADCQPFAADCPPDVLLRDRTTENSTTPTPPPPPVGYPQMAVEPGVVPSGRVTTAVGSGFPSSAELTVTIDATIPPVIVTTSTTGTFRAAIVVPHGVVVGNRLATARARNRSARATFLVVRPPSDVAVLVEGRRQLGG